MDLCIIETERSAVATDTLNKTYTAIGGGRAGGRIPVFQGEWGYASGSGSSPLISQTMEGKLAARLFLVSYLVSDGMSIWCGAYVSGPRVWGAVWA